MIERALRSILINNAAVSATVAARVYQDKLPQNPTYPAIVFIAQGASPVSLLATDTDILESEFDVISVAQTRDAATILGNNVRKALQRYKGTIAGVGYAGEAVSILDCMIQSIDSDYESELEIYYVTVNIKISNRIT